MRNQRRLFLSLFIFVFLFFLLRFSVNAELIVSDKTAQSTIILDYSEILSETEKQEIMDYVKHSNYSYYKIDVLILTAESYSGDLATYITDFYESQKLSKDSVIIFLNNKEIYVKTFGYADIATNDKSIKTILDKGWSDYLNNNFDESITKMLTHTLQYIDIAYKNNITDPNIETNIVFKPEVTNTEIIKNAIPSPLFIVLLGIVSILITSVLISKQRKMLDNVYIEKSRYNFGITKQTPILIGMENDVVEKLDLEQNVN